MKHRSLASASENACAGSGERFPFKRAVVQGRLKLLFRIDYKRLVNNKSSLLLKFTCTYIYNYNYLEIALRSLGVILKMPSLDG
jgi:hypothetical protein